MIENIGLYICVIIVLIAITISFAIINLIIMRLSKDKLTIKIKLPLPKKYKNNISPIYEIKIYEDSSNLCSIIKYTLTQRESENFPYLHFFIPYPIVFFTWSYSIVDWVRGINISDGQHKRTYEDFIKIYEDIKKVEKEEKEKENEKERIVNEMIKELDSSNKVYQENINTTFNKNYF